MNQRESKKIRKAAQIITKGAPNVAYLNKEATEFNYMVAPKPRELHPKCTRSVIKNIKKMYIKYNSGINI